MHATSYNYRRGASAFACLIMALSGVNASAAAPKEADAFTVFDSYVKISGKSAAVTGNSAAYARRFQLPENGSYGIEALHLNKELNKDVSMELDGKALFGAEDYLGKLRLTKTDVGTVEFGYKKFRTFYDGIGGFFPLNKAWMPLAQEELHTDRAKFWADVKIAIPDKPVFHFRYSNDLRNGQKDSTIWGDTDLTGIPIWTVSSQNPYSANRKLVAAYIDLNERQQNLEASVKHTVGNTELELSLVRNWTDSDNIRYSNRYPGELKPWPAIPTNPPSIIPGALANNPVSGFDQQMSQAKIWTYTGKFVTKFSDQVSVFGGLSYQDAQADIADNRQMTLTIRTTPGIVNAVGGFVGASGRPPYSYKTDFGNISEKVLTGNLGVTYKPIKDLYFKLALKGEKLDMEGVNQVTYNSNSINQTTGEVIPVNVVAPNSSKRSGRPWTPELDVRYSGIKGLSLYGAFDYRRAPGDVADSTVSVGLAGKAYAPSFSSDNSKVNRAHYKVGANWKVSSMVTLQAETFYKNHVNSYIGYGTSLGGRYILGYQFRGIKLTGILKPLPDLTFTTRYLNQAGKMDTTVDAGTAYESMDSKNHLFGETIDWNPTKQFYMQANLNVVFATTGTAYPRAGGTANEVLRNSDNNYWNASVVVGFALDKSTDAQLQYTRYHANNSQAALVATMPYGTVVDESTITLGLKRKLTDRMVLHAKVGYFDSTNDSTGGNTNFRGPLGYVSLEYAL